MDNSPNSWCDSEHGATLYEATIVIPFYIMLLAISFNLLWAAYSHLTIQFVGRSVLRQAVVGSMVGATAQKKGEDFQDRMISSAKKYGVSIKKGDITICPLAKYPSCGAEIGIQPTLHVVKVKIDVDTFIFGKVYSYFAKQRLTLDTLIVGTREPT